MPEPHTFLNHLAEEGRRMVAAARPDGFDLPAPPCPDWTVQEVLRHTGSVYRHVTHWIRDGRQPTDWERSPEDGEGVLAWLQAGLDGLIDELSGREEDEACATWCPWDRTVGFWCRRMAHETTVHRADVQLAHGNVEPINAELAIDGIEEALTLWLGCKLGTSVGGDGRVVGIAAGNRNWKISAHDDLVDYCLGSVTADAMVTGAPSDVYLWLWGRLPESKVTTTGDATAARKLRGVLRRATQ